jgi:hypothetical protein
MKKQPRWKLNQTNNQQNNQQNNGIRWDIADCSLPHEDCLEMSGEYVSQHVRYRVDENGKLSLEQTLVWPWLRLIPNDTHASMKTRQSGKMIQPLLCVDGQETSLQVRTVTFDGILKIEEQGKSGIEVARSFFPSPKQRAAFAKIAIKNKSQQSMVCHLDWQESRGTARGGQGIYRYNSQCEGEQEIRLEAGEIREIYIRYDADFIHAKERLKLWGKHEELQRQEFIAETQNTLHLITEEPLLNQAFAFAKIRSMESIFRTKAGLLHSPGGLHYYAGIWTNDQAEYTNPFFAFTGMDNPVESSLNCYRLFYNFMGPEMECIPSSIVAEGLDIWEGKGDRGEAAMYAYGLSRFLLTLGCRERAKDFWDGLLWALTYCEQNQTSDGVIRSDSDELEGRFPHGQTNLATSCLTYEALRCSAIIAWELGMTEEANRFQNWREELGQAIERYFGRTLSGFESYRYCEVDESLRAWICIPLATGLYGRKEGTVQALTSRHLWTDDGLRTMEADETYWDRSTLYALRGIFAAGYGDTGISYLREYSTRRLLGEHVPYPVEAFPEGSGRHLSAESALYARIYLEGLLGISPTGFQQFTCCPSLPENWGKIELKNIQYGGKMLNLTINQYMTSYQYEILVEQDGNQKKFVCKRGEKVNICIEK